MEQDVNFILGECVMGMRGEKSSAKKPSKKEVKKKKVIVFRVGQKCPACKDGSIVRRAHENYLFFRRGITLGYLLEHKVPLPLECSSCKTRFKEKVEKKVYSCRVGQRCPQCKTPGSVVERDMGNHISLGDGMVSHRHLKEDAFFPFECATCKARFKKARESIFSRLKRTLLL